MELKAHRTEEHGVDGLEIVPAHPQRKWMNDSPMPPNIDGTIPDGKGWVNRCLPLLMANQIGWEIKTKVPYIITMLENGTFIIHFSQHPPHVGRPENNFGLNIVTWPMPWVFETPKGWDLLVTSPMNTFLPTGVTCLSGLVETDPAIVTFTINWRMQPKTSIFIEAGTPLATLIPFPTEQLEGWTFVEDDEVPVDHWTWRDKRREQSRANAEDFGKWGKDYWNKAKRRKIKRA